MALTTRVDLLVPYVEEDAKALGARWDKDRKVWYAPPGIDPSTLGRWLLRGYTPSQAEESKAPSEPEEGTASIDLLAQLQLAIERDLPETAWVRAPRSATCGAGTATSTSTSPNGGAVPVVGPGRSRNGDSSLNTTTVLT